MKDVTERHEAEEHRRMFEVRMQHTQKLESLGVLAGGIAHDFNNLLMGIMGHADLALLDIPPDSKARESIQEILHISRRAADLSRQMLAYSGKGRFVIESIDMRDIVREMAGMIDVSISKKANLSITYPETLLLIEADASQIRQIVMNLIINASEAIGDANGKITVSMGSVECTRADFSSIMLNDELMEGVYVSLMVADTGQGMDEETRARIFDPFFTTKFTGRGLGLAAALGIVRGHKGSISVESSPGKGSTFTVLLPDSERRRKKRKRPVQDNHDWQGNGTVLLVDDE
jgi:signal transduction histidine kinase